MSEPNADSVCDHPLDAIMWNEWNKVMQCHRCGQIMDCTPMPSSEAMRWNPAQIDSSGHIVPLTLI